MRTRDASNPGTGFGGARYPGTFLLALREAIAQLRWSEPAWQPAVLECLDPEGRTQQIGLDNLYRRLRREPRERWRDLLVELLTSVTRDAATPPESLHAVADQLLVRLGPPASRQDPETEIWQMSLAAGRLVVSLVIDYPTSMSYVSTKLITESGHDAAYWLARAVENLRAKSPPECVQCVHEETGLLQAQAADAYDSSRGFVLDQLAPGHEVNGFFAIAPGRDHLLFVPVRAETMAVAPWMRAIAIQTFQETPYPISPELFWIHEGVWHLFEIETQENQVIVTPPAEFAEVMARLESERTEPPGDDDSLEMPN